MFLEKVLDAYRLDMSYWLGKKNHLSGWLENNDMGD
jgi:hypothetical protein